MVLDFLLLLCLAVLVGTDGAVIIRHGPSQQRVRAATTVTFRCLADIEPLPLTPSNDVITSGVSIEWKKDGRTIASSRSPAAAAGRLSRVTWRQDGRQLTVANVTSPDSGNYSCTARHGNDVDTASAQLTVEDVPDPPVDVQIVSCDARVVQLKWRLVAENNSPVTQYIVEYNTSFRPDIWQVAKTQQARDRYQRITLSPWGNYSFRVVAQNAVGASRPSSSTRSTCQTPPDVPHINPRGVCTKNIRPHTLAISWEPMPLEEQNAPGFHYLVRWRRHDLTATTTYEERTVAAKSSSLIMEGHPIYKPYEIFVLAINEIGDAASPPRMALGYSSEDVPQETPQNFRLNPDKAVTDKTADFQWVSVNTAPWTMQGFFRGYKIQFWKTLDGITTMREHSIIYQEPSSCWRNIDTSSGGAQALVTANSHAAGTAAAAAGPRSTSRVASAGRRRKRDVNSAHVYNLWPYTNVSAQIVALNALYEGPPSNAVSFMTKEGVPGPIGHLVVISRGSHHVRIGWEPPAEINGRLLGYTLTHKVLLSSMSSNSANDEDQVHEVEDIKTRLTLEGLTPQQTYRLTLCARTAAGRGIPSYIDVRTLPHGAPVAPNFTAVPLDQHSVNVSWSSPLDGIPGTSFSIYYRIIGSERPALWTHSVEETEKDWTIVSGLEPGVVYEMKIIARNGDSEDSPKSTSRIGRIRTGSKDSRIRVRNRNTGSLSIDLAGRDSTESTERSYYVQYRPKGSSNWHTTERLNVNSEVSLAGLENGVEYELRAVIQTDLSGDKIGSVQTVVVGSGPDAQPSRHQPADIMRRYTNNGSSSCCIFKSNLSLLRLVLITISFGILERCKFFLFAFICITC